MLQDLRNQGVLEGQGSFTLDPEAALEKLARFQLPRPHLYAARLAQAAVAAGAVGLDVNLSSHHASFAYSGEPLTSLERVPLALLDGQATREMRYLSSALLALMALHPAGVCLASHGEKLVLGEPVRRAVPDDRTSVTARFLKGTYFWSRPELKVLHERCAWSLLAVGSNGRLLNRYFGAQARPGNGVVTAYELDGLTQVLAYDARPGLLPGTACNFGHGLVWMRDGEVLARGHTLGLLGGFVARKEIAPSQAVRVPWLTFDGFPAVACTVLMQRGGPAAAFARLFQDGVALEKIPLPHLRDVRFHVVADHLQTDLSGFHFVRDEAFARLLEELPAIAKA